MILVTGATGNVGSQVVQQLLDQGKKVRVYARDAAKVARWGNTVDVTVGDFADRSAFAAAVSGVEAIFLMNVTTDLEVFRQLVATAKENGKPRLVFLSSVAVSNPDSPIGQMHKAKEDVLQASGLPVAVVRAGGFMSNALQWIGSIRGEGVVYNGMGDGPFAPIDPADIAAVAVHALTAPSLTESLYEVTGGELVPVPEQVRILGKVLGKPLKTVDVPPEAAAQSLARNGLPPQLIAGLRRSMEDVRAGRASLLTDTVRRITRRPPRTFQQWAQEHASRFA